MGWCAIGYVCPKIILISNIAQSHLSITSISVVHSFSNFAQSLAVKLPYSVQNFKMIGLLNQCYG